MDNWYWDESFKNPVRYLQNIDKDTTIYAGWYNRITFMPGTKLTNSGSGAAKVEKQKYLNKTYTLNRPNDKYTIANYTLDGWSLTDGGEKVYDLGYDYTDNVHITLYPHWVEIPVVTHYGAVTIEKYSDKTIAKIDGEYTGEDAVEITKDIHVDQVVFNRMFTIGKMSTIMLPFSIDTSKVKGGKFYRFKRVDVVDGLRKVILGSVKTQQIGANTPYLVMPETSEITFEGEATFNTETDPSEPLVNNGWEFKGVYAHKMFGDETIEDDYYGFAGQEREGAKVGQFVKLSKGANAPALRAYLMYHQNTALAKSAGASLGSASWDVSYEIDVVIVDENDNVVETGKLNTLTGEVRMDRWFDLNGRKLNAKPTTRGTYYYNGKRVVVK
jgi:hypothetical protein